MKATNNRYVWLDIIKAICILTVVLLHISYITTNNTSNSIWQYLSSVGVLYQVTIFYCVAGITLNNDKLKNTWQFLTNKFKKLYIKSYIVAIIAVLLHNVFIKINFYKLGYVYSGKTMIKYEVLDYLKNTIYTIFFANREVILGAFWFVWSLMICFIILAVLEFIINKIKFIKDKRLVRLFITFCLMCFAIYLSNIVGITIPRFNNSLVGVFLLDATNYLYINKTKIFNSKILLIITIPIAIFAPFFGHIAMNNNVISNPLYLIIVVFSYLYLLMNLSKLIEKIKVLNNSLAFIGENSFGIMAFHFLGFKIASCILHIFNINADPSLLKPIAKNFWLLLYYLIFAVAFSLLLNYIIKKIFKISL